jgi:hypothetical protein
MFIAEKKAGETRFYHGNTILQLIAAHKLYGVKTWLATRRKGKKFLV